MKDLCSLLNEDFRCQCYIIGDDLPLEQIVHREYLIVTVSASIVLFSDPSQNLLRLLSPPVRVRFV